MVYVFNYFRKDVSSKKKLTAITKLIISISLFIVISKGYSYTVTNQFFPNGYKSYPIWNQFYIGINETEFGFMDGDFSFDRSFEDVVNRVEEYGPIKISKIFIKKTHWIWMQGTYQAQRYGFGSDVEYELDKFEYETPVTKYLLRDDQLLRRIANSFMRVQYMILFGLMMLVLIRKKNISDMRVLYYVMVGTFLILLIYEMKSRYIISFWFTLLCYFCVQPEHSILIAVNLNISSQYPILHKQALP